MVIGASFPCYFVAKSEIAKWPIFGFLARLQNTIFVNRKAKGSEINKQVNEIADALKANKTIVLFPEGTTSDGNKILKFKSALFAAAQIDNNQYADIQPLCLNYKYSLGMPVHRQQRPFLAWYGDMELLPHVKSMIKYTPITVFIHIGEPISYKNFNSRQAIAEYLENFMRQAYIVN